MTGNPFSKEIADSSRCAACGGTLGPDDAGATKKFVDRDTDSFLCMVCLCRQLGCTEEFLKDRIEFLRENGCLLFPKRQ